MGILTGIYNRYNARRVRWMKRAARIFLLLTAVLLAAGCGETLPAAPEITQRYFAEDRIAAAAASLDPLEKAEVLSSENTRDPLLALSLDGMSGLDVMEEVTALLSRYGIKATFFLPGMETAEYGAIVRELEAAGHEVGSYSLYGRSRMETLTPEELLEDFVYSSLIMEDLTGKAPAYLRCRNTAYTDQVLSAARAAGFQYAVRAEHHLSYQSFGSYQAVREYIDRLPNGAVVSLRLGGVLEEGEYTPKTPAADAAPPPAVPLVPSEGAAEPGAPEADDERQRLLEVVAWLCRAVYESGREPVLIKHLPYAAAADSHSAKEQARLEEERLARARLEEERREQERRAREQAERERKEAEARERAERIRRLREANGGARAEALSMVHTTERAASFVFYGVADGEALDHTLEQMDALGITGTFFVSLEDMARYPERLSKILQSGSSLGIALLQREAADYAAAVSTLLEARRRLESEYGILASLVKQPFGESSGETREAVSSLGMTLVRHSVAVVQSADEYAGSAAEILPRLFTGGKDAVTRGEIVYFRLDFYKASHTLAGDLVRGFKERYVDATRFPGDLLGEYAYAVKKLETLLANTEALYRYPGPSGNAEIYPGQLDGLSDEEVFAVMRAGYIGNPNVSSEGMLPGFDQAQIAALDSGGTIDVGGARTVFLSFDDWGTDKSVNALLYVLNKHKVKATFFIRTNHVYANPNLLRAIAEEGHDIASHSDSHYTLSNYDPGTRTYSSLTEEQAAALEADLVTSYRVLSSITGDVRDETGRRALTRYFRAPTLAQSYLGMRAVFDCGFTRSVSGDFSTGDYEIESADALLDAFHHGIASGGNVLRLAPGSIVVMHMSAEAKYTAEALDHFFAQNEKKPEAERFTFARLSDYLETVEKPAALGFSDKENIALRRDAK